MAKSKTHIITVTLSFDQPVTEAQAIKAARNHIYGEFYGAPLADGYEVARVRKIAKPEDGKLRALLRKALGYVEDRESTHGREYPEGREIRFALAKKE